MRALAVACLATLFLPFAAAVGEEVDIVDVRAPERTMAGRAFNVSLDLQNHGAARTVYLFAALYEGAPGASPCGPVTEGRFETYTPLYQGVVKLPADGRATFPKPGDTWQQRYAREHVDAAESVDEFCVFVAERQDATGLDWLDFESVAMRTRGENAAPTASFTWEPSDPRAAQDVRFVAEGEDADGDTVTFSWDFGHHNASGRARADGPVAWHPFYPDGTFTVTLLAHDGFDTTAVVQQVDVRVAGAPDATPAPLAKQEDRGIPLPITLAPLAMLLAAALPSRWPQRARCPRAPPRRR